MSQSRKELLTNQYFRRLDEHLANLISEQELMML